MSENESPTVSAIQPVPEGNLNPKDGTTCLDPDSAVNTRSNAQHNRLMWKIDLHILPYLALFYFLSFLDRVNIGNARLFGLESDLGMAGSDFNVALLVFFAPYILFEIPSNLILRNLTPRIWLPCNLPFFAHGVDL
jgi:hypothetical protein